MSANIKINTTLDIFLNISRIYLVIVTLFLFLFILFRIISVHLRYHPSRMPMAVQRENTEQLI